MKSSLFGIILVAFFSLGIASLDGKEPKWDLRDSAVDNYEMHPGMVSGNRRIPPTMRVELAKKPRSVIISLCGPDFTIKTGSGFPINSLGVLSVQNLDKLGWFGSASQVVNGKVILLVETDTVKEIFEKRIQEYRKEDVCSK